MQQHRDDARLQATNARLDEHGHQLSQVADAVKVLSTQLSSIMQYVSTMAQAQQPAPPGPPQREPDHQAPQRAAPTSGPYAYAPQAEQRQPVPHTHSPAPPPPAPPHGFGAASPINPRGHWADGTTAFDSSGLSAASGVSSIATQTKDVKRALDQAGLAYPIPATVVVEPGVDWHETFRRVCRIVHPTGSASNVYEMVDYSSALGYTPVALEATVRGAVGDLCADEKVAAPEDFGERGRYADHLPV